MRLVKMNGVDIELFQFDWDLTWAAFFMNRHGHIYARYGARQSRKAEELLSAPGLRRVMEKVLDVHKAEADRKPPKWTPRTPETFRTLPDRIRSGKNCMHCHQVWDYQRRDMGASFNKFSATEVYPLPDNLGMTLDRDLANVVARVDAKGPAAKAGVREKDEIVAINGTPVYSAADASWALHNADKKDPVRVELLRDGERKELKVAPSGDWRRRDISWRGSMWPLRPHPGFGGRMLDAADLEKIGATWAFRVEYLVDWGDDAHVGNNAKKAGIKKGDIVVAAGGKHDFGSELEFQSWFRLTQKPGTDIEFGVVRGGKPVKVTMRILP